MTNLPLHKVSSTATKITLGWTPVPGAIGYRFQSAGNAPKWSHTWDPSRNTVTFANNQEPYVVQALGAVAEGTWPGLATDWDRFLEWYKTGPPQPLVPNKTAGSESDARAKIAGLQAGDVLRVTNVIFTRSSDGPCLNLENLPPCTIEFVNCRAVHTGRTLYPVIACQNWHQDTKVYGLEITGPNANQGIRTDDSRGTWWGFRIHNVGGTGLMTVALDRNDGPYDFRGEITQAGLRLDLDPHTEKGTGVHGAYIGGSADNQQGNSGTFVLHVHDQPHGAAIQLGSYVYDSTIVCWAERITFNAQTQVAGNALQWWGGNLRDTRVPFVYGKDLAGRVVETDGTGGADTPIVHEYGRGERVCLNPRLSNVAYAPKPNFVYQDCEATYA